MDIKKIPTAELEEDLQNSRNDIGVCQLALDQGTEMYSGGSVKKRLDANRGFVNVITKELERRQLDDIMKEDR